MTKEQKAEAYASSIVERDYHEDLWLDLRDAFIAGAHNRDEEIKELRLQRAEYEDKLRISEHHEGLLREEINRLDGVNNELEKTIDFIQNKLRNPWISVEDGLPPLDETRDIHEEMVYPNLSIEVVLSDGNRMIGGIYNYGRKDWSYDFPMLESFAPKFWMPIQEPKGGEK